MAHMRPAVGRAPFVKSDARNDAVPCYYSISHHTTLRQQILKQKIYREEGRTIASNNAVTRKYMIAREDAV